MAEWRYKAFISYSWTDKAWGDWLARAIETYRTPAALIGQPGAFGPVPARLHPLFMDREEQAASASVGSALETALAESEFLIVLCSPRAAASKWVNHEIAWFKAHRDPARILALIVAGEPGGEPGDPEHECFPPALTHRIDDVLAVTQVREDEPLAADVRDGGDGRRRARLKLAAAMLGVGLDDLVHRDERRRTLRTRLMLGASLALATVMSGLALFAVQQRDEARHQRAEADSLVEFMLTDLRQKLEPVGRLDALDAVGQRALTYYATQDPGHLDADALGRRSRALHLVGEVRNTRGDTGAALVAFSQASATTRELLARDPGNAARIFDHAQSVFWVGYAQSLHGDVKAAEAGYREYQTYADQLVALDPANPKWQAERYSAENNLGTLYYGQGRYAEAEPAFVAALAGAEAVLRHEPASSDRAIETGVIVNWLAKTRAKLNRGSEALALHRREIALYRGIEAHEPGNATARKNEALAWQHIGQLELARGDMRAALDGMERSIGLFAPLIALEPGNAELQEGRVRAGLGRADVLFWLGRHTEARTALADVAAALAKLQASDAKNVNWTIGLPGQVAVEAARLDLAEGKAPIALDRLHSAIDKLGGKLGGTGATTPEQASILGLATLLAGEAEARAGHAVAARRLWQDTLAGLDKAQSRAPVDLTTRLAALKHLSRQTEADRTARDLERLGYRHPAFLALR